MSHRTQKQIIIGLITSIVMSAIFFGVVLVVRDKIFGDVTVPIPGNGNGNGDPPIVLEELQVLFSDFFEITRSGKYDAVAHVINPNPEDGASRIMYEFIFWSENNEVIKKVEGKTFILPNEFIYIVEPALVMPSKPQKLSFNITDTEWRKLKHFSPLGLSVDETNLLVDEETSSSIFSGVVRNRSPYNLKEIQVDVVIYDSQNRDNPIAAGRTDMQDLIRDADRFFQVKWPYKFKLPGNVDIDARVHSNFFENSNFIRDFDL